MLKCKKCGSNHHIKSGHVRGHQRYKCSQCHCQFTDTKPRGVSPALKQLAIVLYAHCGVSMLGIAKPFNGRCIFMTDEWEGFLEHYLKRDIFTERT